MFLILINLNTFSQSDYDYQKSYEKVSSVNSEVTIENKKFKIIIKKDKTKVNVRNTFKIEESKVIAQVNENEVYSCSKIASLNNDIYITSNGFNSYNYTLNGIKKYGPNTKFIKGLKLNNIFIYNNGDIQADLNYNVNGKKETYNLRIPERFIEKKSSSKWYYIDLIEGWILSDFSDRYN
jgi:hypothetical protein|tara:strand:- start:2574 stop:3113 length:540 start_codon:yes stop_codon:yes gene_type:complete